MAPACPPEFFTHSMELLELGLRQRRADALSGIEPRQRADPVCPAGPAQRFVVRELEIRPRLDRARRCVRGIHLHRIRRCTAAAVLPVAAGRRRVAARRRYQPCRDTMFRNWRTAEGRRRVWTSTACRPRCRPASVGASREVADGSGRAPAAEVEHEHLRALRSWDAPRRSPPKSR